MVSAAEEYFTAKGKTVGDPLESQLIYACNHVGEYELSYSLEYENGARVYISLLDLDVTDVYEGNY